MAQKPAIPKGTRDFNQNKSLSETIYLTPSKENFKNSDFNLLKRQVLNDQNLIRKIWRRRRSINI